MDSPFDRPASPTKLDPGPLWSIVTDAPLKGLGLAREAGRILAWDDTGQIYLLNTKGEFLGVTRAPGTILHGCISDNGQLIAFVGEGSRLWLFGAELEAIDDRQVITDPTAITVDPHGKFVAVASKLNLVQLYNRFGKMAGRFETRQYLSHLAFVPSFPIMIGIGALGSISAYDLTEKSAHKLDGELSWTVQLMTGVGRLAMTGDGGMILLGCFGMGVQRFNLQGKNEGAYHLGGSASHAVPDFAGRLMAVATQEGELSILSGNGNIRWTTKLPRPAVSLEVDPLGQYLVYGTAAGEITLLDFLAGPRAVEATDQPKVGVSGRPGGGSVRHPDWAVDVVANEDQAEYVMLGVVDEPPRIGMISSKNKLELFSKSGKHLGQAPEIAGVGRIVRTCPGWIAAATDRQIVVCDLYKNTAQKVDLSLAELTHLVIQPDTYGLAIVQESDRIGRATVTGRWIWKAELREPVEEICIDEFGNTAVTLESGILRVYNPGGTVIGQYQANPPEPLLLLTAPRDKQSLVAWISLARRNQVIRGHDLQGRVIWESPTPWEGWSFHSAGSALVVSASDGRAVAYDGRGNPTAQGGRTDSTLDLFFSNEAGEVRRVSKQSVHLLCSVLDGRVDWRNVADAPLGPMAVGKVGVAIMMGQKLAWFSNDRQPA
jgi:hypothetical protein